MRYSIKKMLGTIPVVFQEERAKAIDSDTGEYEANANFVVVNPKDYHKVSNVLYAYTLIPFRNDMIVPLDEFEKMVGLNHVTDDSLSAGSFESDGTTEQVLGFFATAGGKANPIMREWVRSEIGSESWAFFRREDYIRFQKGDSVKDNPLLAVLKELNFIGG